MIRKITVQDKNRVLEISNNIWEGDDYISQVFDDWVSNPNGLFCGLWENDKLVGFGKLTHLTDEDIWLEGLRKDEKSGVKRVGEKLSRYYINYLKGKKVNSVRFSTYFGNLASIKLNEKLGFKRILTLSLKSKPIQKTIGNTENIDANYNFEEVKKYIQSSQYLEGTKNFVGKGWVVHKFNEQLLKEFHDKKQILVCKENNKITGCAIWCFQHYQNIIWISFLEAETKEIMEKLVARINEIGCVQRKKEMQIITSDGKLMNFLKEKEFSSWEQDQDFLIYELPKTIIDQITGS